MKLTKNIDLHQKQIDFLKIESRYGLFQAGIASGKTFIGCLWAAMMVYKYPKSRGLIAARDVPQLRNATLVEFNLVLKEHMGLQEGVDYRYNKQLGEYKFSNGSIIICTGALNYDTAFRGPSYSWALCDEIDYWKEEAYLALKGRIRKFPEQIRLTSSPKGFNFVYNDFFTKADDTKTIIQSSTYDNPFLSIEYVEDLRKSYTPKLFRQEVMGERVNLTSGAVYSEFDRELHVEECSNILKQGEPVHIFCDYNVSHYLAMVTVFRNDKLYIVGEIHLEDANTHKMAQEIVKRYPNRPIMLSGDSTGNNARNVASDYTNYQIFESYGINTLKAYNGPVMQRVINVENALYHKNVIIDSSCKTLIRDLELMVWKLGLSNEPDKSDITLSHAADAFGYSVNHYLPMKAPKKKSSSRYL